MDVGTLVEEDALLELEILEDELLEEDELLDVDEDVDVLLVELDVLVLVIRDDVALSLLITLVDEVTDSTIDVVDSSLAQM